MGRRWLAPPPPLDKRAAKRKSASGPKNGLARFAPGLSLFNTLIALEKSLLSRRATSAQPVHMNGRAYDYNLGRFLSVDPFIQFPANSQSLNPYSYIMNNPMSGTDPSGYATCHMKDSSSCLEDGVNTIKGGPGQEDVTVVVGSDGDHVNLGLNNADQLQHVSSGIHVSGTIDNGRSGTSVTIDPGGAPSEINGIARRGGTGCNGSGPLQCYDVSNDFELGVTSFERTYAGVGGTAAVNGIMNKVGRAMALMSIHARKRYGANQFTLVHNPTEGFLRDMIESARDKLGITSPAAAQLADVLMNAAANGGSDFVAHSQGGILFAQAMSVNRDNGVGLSNLRVAFHAGGNNQWRTNYLAGKTGVQLYGEVYYDNWNDAVPQILGLRGLFNPVKFIGSAFSAPLLFSNENLSPHTLPAD